MEESDATLRARLNAQTGRISWPELQRHFARGVVVRVDAELDLVEVALHVVRDHTESFEAWAATGQVARARDRDAEGWNAAGVEFWAVVVPPWVLVQEVVADVGA